ncbi:MAG: hypothetical protein ACNA7Q_12100, partial [Rhodobacterales bacterium]
MNKNKVNIIIDAVDRASPQIGQVDKRIAALAASVKVMGVAMAGAAVAGLAAATAQAIQTADGYAKLAQQTGLSVEALSTLDHAAKLSGTNIESLTPSTTRMARSMAEAQKGTGAAANAFRRLRIDVADSDGSLRDNEEVLKDIADRFAAMEDGAQKTALAMDIFGRSGAELIPLLNNGAAGIEKMQLEARRLGLEIDTKTAKAAEKFNDDLERLKSASNGLARSIMTAVIPALGEFATRLQSTFAPTIEQEIAKIDTRVKQLQESLQGRERMGKPGGPLAGFFQSMYGNTDDIEAELAKLLTLRAELEAMLSTSAPGDTPDPFALAALEEDAKKAADLLKGHHELRLWLAAEQTKRQQEYEQQRITYLRRLRAEEDAAEKSSFDERMARMHAENNQRMETENARMVYLRRLRNEEEQATAQARQAAADLGLTFSSAFEDAIVNGNRLRDVLQGLAQDIARMVLRQTVTTPLANAISGGLQGLFPSA